MTRDFLFLAGEFRVTMPTVFEREHWGHTMSSSRLMFEDGRLHRKDVDESLRGVIHYANCEDDERERANLQLLADNNVPCWPNPHALIAMLDRHEVLRRCIELGMPGEGRQFVLPGEPIALPYPYVVKTGNAHRGQGKHLIRCQEELPTWDGIATVEPYWEGVSVRILKIGERRWVARYDNKESWIKNDVGAEVSQYDGDVPGGVVAEALRLACAFGLDVAGLDYVVDRDGVFRFLEINQYPGLDVFDDQVEWAREFLRGRMDAVEKAAEERRR